jgi:hypothetical protein
MSTRADANGECFRQTFQNGILFTINSKYGQSPEEIGGQFLPLA